MIVTGAVPEQQFSTLIPWMMEKFGKKVYTIAADYNFGQISAEWVRNIVKQNGGEMVGEEFIPLGVSQFSSDHPEHPEGQARRPDHAAGRHRAGFLLRAGGRRQPQHSDGQFGQRRPGLRAQALQAAEPRQHVRDDQLDRGGRHARRARNSSPSGTRSSRTSPTSTRRRKTPISRSISTSRWSSGRTDRPSGTTCAR